MLISFTVENWMSFRDKVTFSMVASRERQHGERVPVVKKYNTRVLPVTSIYGGNASGKTSLFMAINFVKKLVVDGMRPDSIIPVKPFLLDDESIKNPTYFAFELLIDETIYDFSFAVTLNDILEEKLVRVSSASEKTLYSRQGEEIKCDKSLPDGESLKYVAKGTQNNQLFLTNSVSQKVEHFKPVYNWFKDTLDMIAPDSRFGLVEQFFSEDNSLSETVNVMLQNLDTGIINLDGEKVSADQNPFLKSILKDIQSDIKEGQIIRIPGLGKDRFVITRENNEIVIKKLVAYHSKTNGDKVLFELGQESDGSKRVIDLLPAFISLLSNKKPKVYIVDEIGRSLHTLLVRRLLETYLSNCTKETRSQLLFTTHDVLLMDQKIFRRDEMWVTERGISGESNLISFSEYKDVRNDKDIRKSYLQGRMGGIPRILIGEALSVSCIGDDDGSLN